MFVGETIEVHIYKHIQPIADRVAQNLEIISETSTYQTSADGIYD